MNTFSKKIDLKHHISNITIFLLILIGTYIFFDNVLFNNNLISGRGDGRLNTLFAEHWFHVFLGEEGWKELPSFYPTTNVLSYSDIMLGFSIPYSVFRLFGINMYAAFKYSVIVIHLIGSFTLYYFANVCLKCSRMCSFIAVIGFSFSNGYYAIAGNPQLYAESFVPIILICFYYYIHNFNSPNRHFYALVGLSVFALLFYTAFYVAFYALLFVLILGVFTSIAFVLVRPKGLLSLLRKILAHWKEYIIYILFAILLMVPFIDLYLPTLHTLGGRSWEDIIIYTPTIQNVFGFGYDNPWNVDTDVYHLNFGFSPLLLVIFVLLFGYYIYSHKINTNTTSKNTISTIIFISAIISVIFSMFLPVTTETGFSLWYFIYKIIPGASAIRAVIRWLPFLTLPFSICFCMLVEHFANTLSNARQIILIVFSILVFTNNYSTVGVNTLWNETSELKFIESVSAPPKDCKIMFLTDSTSTYSSNL